MDPVILARIQFAFTIGFHYLFPPLTIGMSWIMFYMYSKYRKTGDTTYKKIADFWTRLFAISFAIGVASGIVMEFQFGTNWSTYSKYVGDIFGAPLAAEGIFAFFLESSFLGVLLYGKEKISKTLLWVSSMMVAFGSTLSAFWIIVANSWQQTPAGYEIVNGRAELVDFWAAVFNPSTLPRYTHTILGCVITGAFFIMGISAYLLLKKKNVEYAKKSLIISLVFGAVSTTLMFPVSHWHAVQVANTQPIKLAAFEGHWETEKNADFIVFGIPNVKEERTDFAIRIPGMLSMLVGNSLDTEVQGLKSVPKEERPPIMITFFSFHTMIALGMFFFFITMLGLFLWWKGKLYSNTLYLKTLFFSIPLPFICNELGWIAAEVGRQPWVVQGLLKTKDAASVTVGAGEILFSLFVFAVIYAFLFSLWVFLLKRKVNNDQFA